MTQGAQAVKWDVVAHLPQEEVTLPQRVKRLRSGTGTAKDWQLVEFHLRTRAAEALSALRYSTNAEERTLRAGADLALTELLIDLGMKDPNG